MSDWGSVYDSKIKLKESKDIVNDVLRIVYFKNCSNPLEEYLNYKDCKINYNFDSHPELEWMKALLFYCTDDSYIDYKSDGYGSEYELLVHRYKFIDGKLTKTQIIPYDINTEPVQEYYEVAITNIILDISIMKAPTLKKIKDTFTIVCSKSRKTLFKEKVEYINLEPFLIDGYEMIFKPVSVPVGYSIDETNYNEDINIDVAIDSEEFRLIKNYIIHAVYTGTDIQYPKYYNTIEKLMK